MAVHSKSSSSVLASTLYGYDAASRLATVGDGTNSAGYGYLANASLVGNITFERNGQMVMTTAKQYDNLNRLTSTASSAGAPVSSFNYQYNSANQRTSATNVDSSYWVYQYDALGQVVSGKKYWADGTPVAGQQFTYNFDNIGNREATASGGDGSGANLRTANYTANNLNEYTRRDVPGYVTVLGSANPNATVTVNLQRAYRYGSYFQDELAVNNSSAALWQALTNLAVLNNGTNADIIATNTGNVLVPEAPEVFGYDLDGNLTNSGRWTIVWDAENRATSFASLSSLPAASQKKVDCLYDSQGRRIQKVVSTWNGSSYVAQSTNRFVYDGWNLVGILDGYNHLLDSFQWGTDLSGSVQGAGGVGGLISMTVCSGTNAGTYFYSFDGNGNVAALVNAANGTIAAQYEYDPFLGISRASGVLASINPFLGSTKFYDSETGLYYYGYRYYDASAGRWLSRDPIEEMGGINVYAFLGNSAVSKADGFGLSDIDGYGGGNINENSASVFSPLVYQMPKFPGPNAGSSGIFSGDVRDQTESITIIFSKNCVSCKDKANEIYQGLKTFKDWGNNTVASILVQKGEVQGQGVSTVVSFDSGLMGDLSELPGPNDDDPANVSVSTFDAQMTVMATTLGNHMLVGKRTWSVSYTEGRVCKIVVQTRGIEQTRNFINWVAYNARGGDAQNKVWNEYLQNIAQAQSSSIGYMNAFISN